MQHKAQSAFEAQKKTDIMSEAEKEELEVTKRRAEGTPCNKENFEAWQSRFLRERAADKAREEEGEGDGKSGGKKKDKVKDVDKSGRLTGFEHFNSKMDNLEALEAAAEAAEQGFEDVDEELFDDDVDLDDLDFDDEDDDEEEDEDVDI